MKAAGTPTVVLFKDDTPRSILLQKCRLRILSGAREGEEVTVHQDTFTIGSGRHNDLVLRDATVSSNHCEIRLLPEGYLIRDLDSTNGTLVQGVRVSEAYLDQGDEIQLGTTRLAFSPLAESAEVPLPPRDQFGALIGRSVAMKKVFHLLERYADTSATILIAGETGTGKEILAEEIHRHSARSKKPFVVVDCCALARGIVESELFGHTRGAFTGAAMERKGAFELADGGTLFLDEIGDLSLQLQPKLLRALEKKEIRRLGSNEVRKIDVRIISATNRELEREVNGGRFRDDLYYRLSVAKIEMPPLRERKADIPFLVGHFLEQLAGSPDLDLVPGLAASMDDLLNYEWPGNVRELKNFVERAYHAGSPSVELGPALGAPDASRRPALRVSEQGVAATPFKTAKNRLIRDFEARYLEQVLARHGWNISRAAMEAGIERGYLQRLIRKHGLSRGRPPPEDPGARAGDP